MNRVSPISRSHPARADAADGSVPHRYWAYLSYSHRDEVDAKWLHEALEKFTVPPGLVGREAAHGPIPKSFAPIFRDRQELAASSDLGSEIRQALARSRFLIVLCSPAAAVSHWTNEEIATFKRLHPDRRILAAVVAGEPWASLMPGREAEECFPPALRTHFDSRGRPTRKRAEPIAADLREGRDGRRMGMLKVAAGMLGVGLDDLVQRDAQRRQRRLKYIVAASLAGMTLTSGLAVFAFDKRDEARDQRREAEGLVGFMLGDLRGKLEPLGRLDALDAVGARALAYFKNQDKSELSDAALAQRSRALTMMGEIAQLRGDLDGALARYGEAMAGTAEMVRRAPDDPQRLFDHAQNVFWVGEVARQRGRLDQAEAAFREYKHLAGRMVAIDPDSAKWRMETQYADANLGIVLLAQRRFAEASRQFQQALNTIERFAAADPRNGDYQKSLAESLGWLADAKRSEGQVDEAIAQRERQLALLDRLSRAGRGDVEYRQKLIPTHQALGWLFSAKGADELAIAQFRSAVNEADRLIPTEPDNMLWRDLASRAHLALADALMSARKNDEAAAQTRAGCDLVGRLIALDSSVVEWRVSERICLTMRARLALDAGADEEALALARQALAAARSDKGTDSIEVRYTVANAYRLLGDIHRQMGDRQSARIAWQAGLDVLPRRVAERPTETSDRAELIERLGRTGEAAAIRAKLDTIGYRRAT
ncbi:MAG TPA: TIR domain-containing protein [Sphingomicrobium sp.]|nr:TIR domain-containing protein [Sphingomicrobium sp.]